MKAIIHLMIFVGIIIMTSNIYRYVSFMYHSKDVLSDIKLSEKIWKLVGAVLLVFFLCGYIGIVVFGHPDILMASILLGGSVFVAIVLTLMFHLIETAKKRSIEVAEVLIEVIEARDSNLNGHSRYVQNLTMLFFKYIPSELRKGINDVSLEYAALLHDVGKLGVPESVLNKPGMLNQEEWKIMRTHPRTGGEILKPLKSFESIIPWIEYHHERIDGKGYYGLTEEEIPMAARIIAIADTYSAITMKRAYKPAKSHEEAIEIIKRAAGTQLDAVLVKVFCSIPKEELEECIPECLEK
ncbi:MAG: HD domain-containing protein [Agathobacter sp.]|nr:HD domain-containing protein [Agathobacter sp.]